MSITEYLEQIRKSLKKQMPEATVASRLRELETHLRMASAEHRAAGTDEASAERKAVAEMGAVKVVVSELVRQHCGYSLKTTSRLSGRVGPIVFVAIALPFLSVINARNPIVPMGFIDFLWDCCAWVAILAFGARVLRTRRWIAGRVSLWACASVLVLFLASSLSAFDNQTTADRALVRKQAVQQLQTLALEQKAVANWRLGNPPKGEGPVPNRAQMNHRYPLLPMPISSMSTYSWSLSPMSERAAKESWAANGDRLAQSVVQQEQMYRAWERNNGPATTPMIALAFVRLVVLVCVIVVSQLFAWNALLLAIGVAADRWRNARFRSASQVEMR